MPRPRQSEQIQDLPERIMVVAYQQIAREGASALSLRSIARQLGITAPAIYNYYPSRDELVTALIVEAFTSLGKSQRSVLAEVANADLAEQFSALGLAYRDWAITYPQRYQLIFGTPIPSYSAPADVTVPAAAWSLQPLIGVLQVLATQGALQTNHLPPCSAALKRMLADWQAFTAQGDEGMSIEQEVLYLALVIWSRVHGLVMLEIGNQMPSFITDPGEVYRREIELLRNQLTGS